jgi:DNA-binding MarR family transcriptional regulator
MTTPAPLPPASQKLLREIAKYDTGAGVLFRHAARGRYSHPNTLSVYNARTFYPLTGRGLVDDGDNDSAPVRVTEVGRKLAAELEEQHKAEQASKKARPKPSADGATALRLLREIAKHDRPLIYDDGLRRVWRVASRSGHRASIGIWVALEKAGYIRTERVSSIGGHRVSVTPAGRERLATPAP